MIEMNNEKSNNVIQRRDKQMFLRITPKKRRRQIIASEFEPGTFSTIHNRDAAEQIRSFP
jgi:hypothetical protein